MSTPAPPADDVPTPAALEPVELAALADGTLAGTRRAELEARVAASAQLRAELDLQRRALEALTTDPPPASDRLRMRVEAERRRAVPEARRRRVGAVAGLGVVVAACVLVVLFLLPSGVSGPTVIARAAELHGREPTGPEPAAASRALLDLRQGEVPFPNLEPRFGWRVVGVRRDQVAGRQATTALYEKGNARIGYTILSGSLLEPPENARRDGREGTLLRAFDVDGRRIVTWERGGLTCVISGLGVPRAELYDLAGWKARGAVPF